MENQGRAGFSVEGLWEGTPREDRVTARAGRGGGPPRTRGQDGVRGAVAGHAPAQWLLVPMAMGDHGRQPLYSAFSASIGHPPSQKRPTLDASRTLLPRGARERLDSGVFQGPERHPHAPEAPSPPESAAGPEDLRAEAVPSREDASALSAQHREAPRRHLGGPATHRSEGPRNDSQCATSARIGGDAWASA